MSKLKFRSVGECMAELQSAKDGLYSLAFGGDTLNTSWYVRALATPENMEVEYVTAVGRDPLSHELLAFLGQNRIGTRFAREIADCNLGLYLITLAGAERSFTYWRNSSAAKLLAQDTAHLSFALLDADFIYFSGITLGILSKEHQCILFDQLKELKAGGATIAFDSNARPKLWKSERDMREATILGYQVATIALPTFADEQALFGDLTIADCATRIASFGVKEVIIKNGPDPVCGLVDGQFFDLPTPPVSGVVDTTGAGDSFNAGYLVGRAAGMPPEMAANLGHQVAGRVICHRGALAPMSLFSDLVVGL